MKVIKGTKEELETLAQNWAIGGRVYLEGEGREFTEDGYLVNIRNSKPDYSSLTDLKEPVREDSIQGFYLPHPEIKLGDWDEKVIEDLVEAIPENLTIDNNFQPTPEKQP